MLVAYRERYSSLRVRQSAVYNLYAVRYVVPGLRGLRAVLGVKRLRAPKKLLSKGFPRALLRSDS
jgi:hypothetical protein